MEIPTPEQLRTATDAETKRIAEMAVQRITAELKRAFPENETVTVETIRYRHVVCEAVKTHFAVSGWLVVYEDKALGRGQYSTDQRDNDDGRRTVFTVKPASAGGDGNAKKA